MLALRIALAVLALAICYAFDWRWLRYLTSQANLRVDAVAGLRLQRVAADKVLWHGQLFQYTNACCFADVGCAALPLLWNTRRTIVLNLLVIAGFLPALFVFNVLRLSVSDLLYAHGLSWTVGHSVFAGFAYAVVWFFIRTQSNFVL